MVHFGFIIITLSLPSADFTKMIIFLTIMAFFPLGAYYRFAVSRPRPYFYVRPTDLAVVFLRITTSA